MEDWIKFNFNEHESEEEYLFAQEKLIARQDEKQISLKEWNTIWMMYGAKQRKGIENYQLLQLRNVVKTNGEEVQKDFVTKYRELKIESNRGKQAPCADTYLMRNVAYLDKDIMIKGQEEILKEEISTKTEEVGMTPEEDPSIEDIIGETMTDKGVFQET